MLVLLLFLLLSFIIKSLFIVVCFGFFFFYFILSFLCDCTAQCILLVALGALCVYMRVCIKPSEVSDQW